MREQQQTFSVSDCPVRMAAHPVAPFALASNGMVLMMHRSNGQDFHAVYRSRRGAEGSLAAARRTVPDAEVFELP